MLEPTEQQQKLIDAPEPPRLLDPRSKTAYVLVRADVYERCRSMLAENFHPSEAYPAIDRAFAEGWEDPRMDDYDRYEELKK